MLADCLWIGGSFYWNEFTFYLITATTADLLLHGTSEKKKKSKINPNGINSFIFTTRKVEW